MADTTILPGAEPFFFEGGSVGCLVSHGFTGSPQSMRFLGEFLAREGGLTVSGPLLTGHGTRPEDMAQATAEAWIRSLEDGMATLQERCTSIFVTGLSMGGTLTLYLAAMYPQVFRGAIPINGALVLNSPDFAALAFMRDAPPLIDGIGSDIKQPGSTELAYPQTPVAAIRQIYALMAVTRDLLPRVQCPTLVIQSREDHVVPPENGPLILEHVGTSDKRLLWLDDSYHVATLDNDKELIGGEIVNFVRSRAGV